jgi:hypothetical protein
MGKLYHPIEGLELQGEENIDLENAINDFTKSLGTMVLCLEVNKK